MKMIYFSEYAGRVSMTRYARRLGIPGVSDPPPPERFSAEDLVWHLKLVAHWEGGPEPDDPAALPVELVLEKEVEP